MEPSKAGAHPWMGIWLWGGMRDLLSQLSWGWLSQVQEGAAGPARFFCALEQVATTSACCGCCQAAGSFGGGSNVCTGPCMRGSTSVEVRSQPRSMAQMSRTFYEILLPPSLGEQSPPST